MQPLSVREQEVLAVLCKGWENQAAFRAPAPVPQIAEELGVTNAAVKAVLLAIYAKLDIPENGTRDRRMRLAEKAVAYGYVMTPEQRAACRLLAREYPSRYAKLLRDISGGSPDVPG